MRHTGMAAYARADGKDRSELTLAVSLASQHGRPGDPRAIPKFGGENFHAFESARHGMFLCGFDDHVHHLIGEGLDDAAAKNDDIRSENVNQIRHSNADVFGHFFNHFRREFVAAANGLSQITAAEIIEAGSEHFGQQGFFTSFYTCFDALKYRGSAGHGLEAAFVATATFWTVHINHHVANLTRRIVRSAIQLAVQYQTAADAVADKNSHHIARFGFQFDELDTKHGNVRVIFDEDRKVEVLLQFLFKGDIFPSVHVRGEDYGAGAEINRAGRADTDRCHLFEREVGLIDRIPNAAINSFDNRIDSALRFGADLGCSDATLSGIEQPGQNLRSAQVNANNVIRFVC